MIEIPQKPKKITKITPKPKKMIDKRNPNYDQNAPKHVR